MKTDASDTFLDPVEVCTLSPEQLSERLKWIRSAIMSHAIGKRRLDDGVAIEVAEVAGICERIDHWIELEGECCSNIRFERASSRDPGCVRVEIRGIDPKGALLASIPDLPETGPERVEGTTRERGGIGRVLRAGGLGAMASVFTLCVLPMILVSLLGLAFGGAAVSLPLSALDDPLWIGLGAAVAGVGIWWWTGRARRVCDE